MNLNSLNVLYRCSAIFMKKQLNVHQPKLQLNQFLLPLNVKYSSKSSESDFCSLSMVNDFAELSESKDSDTEKIFAKICNKDPEKIKKLRLYQHQIELWNQNGILMSSTLSPKHWLKLLSIPSKSQRKSFLEQLEKKNYNKEHRKSLYKDYLRNSKIRSENLRNEDYTTATRVKYGLQQNSFFLRIRDNQINKVLNLKLLEASLFDPHLIIDCGFEEVMTHKQLSRTAADIQFCFAKNREYFYPHNLIFTDLNSQGNLFKYLCDLVPNLTDPSLPFFYTEKSFLDLYPKNQLIYLTPNSPYKMSHYNSSCIYILGGIIDDGCEVPVTLAKAKKLGIQTARFPIDDHISWSTGSKTLHLKNCISIINDLKHKRSWNYAFRDLIKTNLNYRNYKFNNYVLDRNNKLRAFYSSFGELKSKKSRF